MKSSRKSSMSSNSSKKSKGSNRGKSSQKERKSRESRVRSGNEVEEYINSKRCEVCLKKNYEQKLLLCDRCDDSYHSFCLIPKLTQLPSKDWICPVCIEQLKALLQFKANEASQQTAPEKNCSKCKQSLNKGNFIQGFDQNDQTVKIKCSSLVNLKCLYCKKTFHNTCFSARKNSLNCWECEKTIRKNGPKSHDEFMEYIEKSIKDCKQSDYEELTDLEERQNERHRYYRLKIPVYMTSWQFIVQNQASLYYAFKTKRLTFIDEQIYSSKEKKLMELNDPLRDTQGKVFRLHEKDEKAYEQFKINSKKGYVGPFQVKEDRIKGFYLTATDYIEPNTIVSEYVGEVMTSRNALNEEENDSIFILVRSSRASQSLDIVPQKYGNISRFFSGINNQRKKAGFNQKQNIRSLRFSYRGRVRLLLHTIKPIQAGETLYFDYNGSNFHQYPTDHFVV